MVKKIIALFFIITVISCDDKLEKQKCRLKDGFTAADLRESIIKNETIGVNSSGLSPKIIISIPDEHRTYSKEFIFEDEGGLWFYAHLNAVGIIKLENR
jgi:hypothetical protein